MIKYTFNKLLKEKTGNKLIQLFRYCITGGTAAIVDFSSLYILTELINIHYLISAIIAFIFGLTTNYILSIFWVFNKRRLKSRFLEFVIFSIIGIVGLGLNELIIWYFTEYIHFHYMMSKMLSTVVVVSWNFYGKKNILFS